MLFRSRLSIRRNQEGGINNLIDPNTILVFVYLQFVRQELVATICVISICYFFKWSISMTFPMLILVRYCNLRVTTTLPVHVGICVYTYVGLRAFISCACPTQSGFGNGVHSMKTSRQCSSEFGVHLCHSWYKGDASLPLLCYPYNYSLGRSFLVHLVILVAWSYQPCLVCITLLCCKAPRTACWIGRSINKIIIIIIISLRSQVSGNPPGGGWIHRPIHSFRCS